MRAIEISDKEFGRFQRFIFDAAGITLSPAKKALVCGRLSRRLHHHEMDSFAEYLDLLSDKDAGEEVQTAVDLLTTNETYFFRESRHFDALRDLALAARGRTQPFRVWSAACSSGEEVYTIAMVLADCLGDAAWEVVGSDISQRVLQQARRGHYALTRTEGIPRDFLRRFCLRGEGPNDGTLLIDRSLRQRVSFSSVNLNAALPQLGPFDVIFLRNVMIYFNADTKREVIARVLGQLKPDGHFFIGLSESLNELTDDVKTVAPSMYSKR
jgi:chemotaxis protein methyltransferase CheR